MIVRQCQRGRLPHRNELQAHLLLPSQQFLQDPSKGDEFRFFRFVVELLPKRIWGNSAFSSVKRAYYRPPCCRVGNYRESIKHSRGVNLGDQGGGRIVSGCSSHMAVARFDGQT
jgi:hypothetical protein